MFSTLKIAMITGPNKGQIIPITCIGETNLQYRIKEMSDISSVRIVGVEADNQLSDTMQSFLKENDITLEESK